MTTSCMSGKASATELSFGVRLFIRLREAISEHKEIPQKIAALERRLTDHDTQIIGAIKATGQSMSPAPVPKKRRIGFSKDETYRAK